MRPYAPDRPRIELTLDESVLSQVYVPLLIHAFYANRVDLELVSRLDSQFTRPQVLPVATTSTSGSCLSEVQALIASGRCQVRQIDQTMDVYAIGRFLDASWLCQQCEDIICAHVTLDCVNCVHSWSRQPHGSAFVRRACVDLVVRRFGRACDKALLDMDESLLIDVLRSDYVQSGELDILQAVIRWGEHALCRRMEEREPNVLAGTTHSISRKGVRRCDMSDAELRQILARLLPLVRTDFILPPYHQTLVEATARNLLPCSDSPMASAYGLVTRTLDRVDTNCADRHWLHTHVDRQRVNGTRRRPRVFLPYINEARDILQQRTTQTLDVSLRERLAFNHEKCQANSGEDHWMALDDEPVNPKRHRAASSDGDASHNDLSDDEMTLQLPDWDTIVLLRVDWTDCLRLESARATRIRACQCAYHRRMFQRNVLLKMLRLRGVDDRLAPVVERPLDYYVDSTAASNSSTFPRFLSECELNAASTETSARSATLPDLTRGTGMCLFFEREFLLRVTAGQL